LNPPAAAPPSGLGGLGATTGWAIAGFVFAFALFAANAAGWGVIVAIASAIALAFVSVRATHLVVAALYAVMSG
jgi:hypothetical protein